MNEYLDIIRKKCELIVDLGFDYDGYRDSKNLMELIDELCSYAGDCIKLLDKIEEEQNGNNKQEDRGDSTL